MTGKYLLGNSDVELWTDWTVKLVDMVCISITIYLCQERCMWCNLFRKVYPYSSFTQMYSILRAVTLDYIYLFSMLN